MPSTAHDVTKLILPPGQTLNKPVGEPGGGWETALTGAHPLPLWSGFIHSLICLYLHYFSLQEACPSPHPSLTSGHHSLIQKQNVKTKGKKRAKK